MPQVEFQDARNGDLQIQIRDTEVRLKEKEDQLFVTRRDIENQRIINNQMRNAHHDLAAEKEALEKHSCILLSQNADLTTELDRFCQTDEVLRQ